VIIFIIICLFILIPIWKVLVDSFDLHTSYGMRIWPEKFGFAGYISVFSNPTLFRPLVISFITTLIGTFLGLALSTLGGYVLIQFNMPGRNVLAGLLLFTMIFQGGMIPTYLVVNKMYLTNTLFAVVLLPAINIYNLVFMRNFFEGIPKALFEAAEIDGCSPMQTFFKIVLPLSKAALASIELKIR
jgi:putative aldouronate transport system permease protein